MTDGAARTQGNGTTPLISDTEAVDLLRGMVETSSASGNESAVALLLSQEMSRRGFVSEIDAAGNAIGWRGPRDAEQVIALLGHMDTVPGMIPVRIEGDQLFGRGSVDAKGPLATFVVAASRASLPPNTAIVVIGAVEEETPTSRGARAVVDRFRPAACVIGEPSAWNGITIGYKGRLVMEYSIARDLSHTAGPTGSAADEAFAFWQRVLTGINTLNQGRTGAFDTIQATLRELRTSGDGLTEQTSLIAGFRLPPHVDPNVLQQAIVPLASTGQLDFLGHETAHVSPRDNAVARHLAAAIRREGERPVLRVKTGTSDMNVVAPRWRCPIVAYGPGDSALDHTPNEHISLSEYLRAARVLTQALESLATELASPDPRPADTDAQTSSLSR
ncbi:MAG: [LysW]-lysine hydrolase [Phycisphaerales bacterium]